MSGRLIVALAVVAVSVAVVLCADNWLSDLANSVSGTACLATVTPKLSSDCAKAFDDELESRPKGDTDKKALCCAFLRFESCVLKIAEKECGDNGESVAKAFLKTINRGVTSDDCVDYGFISCVTITQMAIAGAVILALLALLSCICCCCCRR